MPTLDIGIPLDIVIPFLQGEILALYPGSTIRFETRYFPKDKVYQIVLLKEPRTADLFFAQGDGESMDEAATSLVQSFSKMLDIRKTELLKKLAAETQATTQLVEKHSTCEEKIRSFFTAAGVSDKGETTP